MNLTDCLEMAMASHPDLKNADAQVRAARAVVGQAMSAYYPQVNFTSTYTRSGGPDSSAVVRTGTQGIGGTGVTTTVVSSVGTNWNDSLSLQQYITDFGRTPDQVTANQESYTATLFGFVATKNNIINSVKRAYYNCIAAQELLKVRQENVANLETHLKQSQAFYNVGRRAKIEVTKSEVDLANARIQMIQANNAYKVSRVALINAMGIDENINFELARNLTLPEIALSIDDVLKISSLNRPELLQSDAQVRAQKASLAAAVADFYPTITGNAQYNWRGSDYPLDRYWQLGLTLQMPITDGNFRVYQVKQQRAQLDGLVAQRDRLWQNVSFEVQQAYLTMQESRERIGVSEKTLAQADENFRLAKGRYDVGVGSNLEFTDAQVSLLQARTDYISALVVYFNSIADLEKAVGKDLEKTANVELKNPGETKVAPGDSNIKTP
jgi:outer membrane protein